MILREKFINVVCATTLHLVETQLKIMCMSPMKETFINVINVRRLLSNEMSCQGIQKMSIVVASINAMVVINRSNEQVT